MIKNGDLVVCINNSNLEKLLTIGKQYKVSKGLYYTVRDDSGLELGDNSSGFKSRFISLCEYRIGIINGILYEK